MSSTLLEVTRQSHEDVERLERLVVRELQRDPAGSRDRLYQSHRVRNMIDQIVATSNKLVEIYEDKDGSRKDEIAALGGQGANNVISAFYDRLKEIREYHRKNPAARIVSATDDFEELLKEEPVIKFTGEEGFGRYLDMHELYNEYINSKFGTPMEYAAYVGTFSQTDKIPRNMKLNRQYREYLEHVLEYLTSFLARTQPLLDLQRTFTKLDNEFEEHWTEGTVPGWENAPQESTKEPVIDLDYFSTVEELIGLGPEKLKEALAARGLKTGGTVQQRADRLFLLKHTPLEKLDRKHFAKGPHSVSNGSEENGLKDHAAKEVALMEVKLQRLCELLDEDEVNADSESDDEDQQIYNPLKLPMGWDGKPIPYWLYKLHGLGQEFKCEICGNHSYWGRRAYERHFKEWRHQHGMRCLGIPNTKNFNEITSIKEAKDLWEKIQQRQGMTKWRPDLEEEYEDREGNIYNKKTYTDLQRQGLI